MLRRRRKNARKTEDYENENEKVNAWDSDQSSDQDLSNRRW